MPGPSLNPDLGTSTLDDDIDGPICDPEEREEAMTRLTLFLEGRVDALDRVADVGERANTETVLAAHKDALNTCRSDLRAAKQSLGEQWTFVKKEVGQVQTAIWTFEQRLRGLERKLNTPEGRVKTIAGAEANAQAEFSFQAGTGKAPAPRLSLPAPSPEPAPRNEEQMARVSKLEKMVGDLKTETTALQEEVHEQAEQITSEAPTQQAVDHLQDRMTDLENSLLNTTQMVDICQKQARERLDSFRGRLNQVADIANEVRVPHNILTEYSMLGNLAFERTERYDATVRASRARIEDIAELMTAHRTAMIGLANRCEVEEAKIAALEARRQGWSLSAIVLLVVLVGASCGIASQWWSIRRL